MVEIIGGDYSTVRPSIATLQALGIKFVSRYVSWLPNAKCLTLAEAKELSAADISICTNWESDGKGGTYADGQRAAAEGWRQHVACGGPDDRWIYASIDFDAVPESQVAYFKGWNAEITAARTAAYGSAALLHTLHTYGLIRAGWRSMSTGWRGGASTADASIAQTGYFNSSIDRDVALTGDFGQWKVGGTPVSPSPTPVKPQPVPPGAVGIPGADPAAVKVVQHLLNVKALTRPPLVEDGKMGSLTNGAIVHFQKVAGLVADGIVGLITMGALNRSLASYPTVKFGQVNNQWVKLLQQLLTSHGHPLVADGDFGLKTLANLKAFQASRDLAADGVAGHDSWVALQY